MQYEPNLEPPDVWQECCGDEECETECVCETHKCDICGLSHNCRCDADYDEWRDSQDDY